MKKSTEHTRWRSIQVSIAHKRKEAREQGQRKHRSQRKSKKNEDTTSTLQQLTIQPLIAPESFDIDDAKNRRIFFRFLQDLRNRFALHETTRVNIDFSDTEKFTADATLLFHAEVSRLKEMRQNNVIMDCTCPVNDKASEVLHQIGFYKLCNKHHQRSEKEYEDVVHWRVAEGSVVNNELCAPAIEQYEGQLAEPLLNGLFRGLGEAMTNTIHHAYEGGTRNDGLNYPLRTKSWWMFSQAKDGYLSVAFCDLGIGIPRTLSLKKPQLYKLLNIFGKTNKDYEHIKIAIKDKLSRTNQPQRGKGLGDIVQAITRENAGTVKIISNHGVYIKNSSKTVTYDLKESILGTLIYWRVPLMTGSNSGKESN